MTHHPQGPAPETGSLQTSAIILIVVGVFCGGGIPAIFGVIALVQMANDPASATTMNKVGWIIFWVLIGLAVLAVVAYLLFFVLVFGVVSLPLIVGG